MDHALLKAQFEQAYTAYADALFRYFYVRLNDRERAKELVQETFAKSWLYARNGNVITRMRPFLYTTARNLFKNELRDRYEVTSLEGMLENSNFEPVAEDPGAEVTAEGARLLSCVETLEPEEYRTVLMLRYIDGLPVKDIAALLGESAGTTSVRLFRALYKLRKQYEGTT